MTLILFYPVENVLIWSYCRYLLESQNADFQVFALIVLQKKQVFHYCINKKYERNFAPAYSYEETGP